MNFNHWYIFDFVQWPFAIFLVTSWFHAHKTARLYRQKTQPSAISQLHHHWKFYHSRSSAKIERFTIDRFWTFFFDCCVQFVQLTTVDILINRMVSWKQLKKYHTFPILPNRQHNLFLMQCSFRSCMWWFFTLGPWSFSNFVILNN